MKDIMPNCDAENSPDNLITLTLSLLDLPADVTCWYDLTGLLVDCRGLD